MRNDLVEMHDVDIFVMEIEKIDLMGEFGAVEGAFLDQRDMESRGVAVHRTRAYTAGGTFAADDETLNTEQREMRGQRCTLEDAGTLFRDDDVFRLRREFVIDGVTVGGNGDPLPGGDRSLRPVLRAGLLRTAEDGDAGPARGGEEPLGWSDREMGEDAAGIPDDERPHPAQSVRAL